MKAATKAWSFLFIMSLTLVVLGHRFGGREGLLSALVFALGINSYIYFFEAHRVLAMFRGRILEGQDSYGLHEILRRLSLKARVPTPRLIIIPDLAPQAAVVGRGLTHGTVLITEGCLARFSRAEIEAIMAYQLACILSLNTLAFAVGSFLASTGLVFAEVCDAGLRFLIVEKKNQNVVISQIFTRMFSPFIGFILRLSIRPSLYKSADLLASQILDDPKILAQVLYKLDSYSHTLPFSSPLSTAHMFVVNPLTTSRWTHAFVTHPLPRERIRNLIGYYPI